MTTATYFVEGMTCGHCVSSVTTELMKLDGVTEVTIDLEPEGLSAVHVTSDVEISADQASEAIEEAGYQVASS